MKRGAGCESYTEIRVIFSEIELLLREQTA